MNCIGVNYKKVPLDIRASYAFSTQRATELGRILNRECGCRGSVIVSTCNRSEIYFSGEGELASAAGVEEALAAFLGIEKSEMREQIYVYTGKNALRHLFLVACGLDSMVLGEDEILRQVKEAYLLAREAGMVCTEINIAFQGALSSAKQIKTKTLLSKTPVSMGTLAANRIEQFLEQTGGTQILLVGITGKIGSILAKNLLDKGITAITGTSRSHNGFEGALSRVAMVDFADRYAYADAADVIVSATASPHYTFTAKKLGHALRQRKPRLLIDLAVPRDIEHEAGSMDGCTLLDVDDFRKLSSDNNAAKLRETEKAELLLAEKLEETRKNIAVSELIESNPSGYEALKEKSFGSIFYRLKEQMDSDHFVALTEALRCLADGAH